MSDKKLVNALREYGGKVESLRVDMLYDDDGSWDGLTPLASQEFLAALAFLELAKTHITKAAILQDSK